MSSRRFGFTGFLAGEFSTTGASSVTGSITSGFSAATPDSISSS